MPDKQDCIETIGQGAVIQHGTQSDRIYLMNKGSLSADKLLQKLDTLAQQQGYAKIFAKVSLAELPEFLHEGYQLEAFVQNFYQGEDDLFMVCRYHSPDRSSEPLSRQYDEILSLARSRCDQSLSKGAQDNSAYNIRLCQPSDADEMAKVYQTVFPSYPFPIQNAAYLQETMASHIDYYCVIQDGRIVALSSAEIDYDDKNAEMTDFATLPDWRGKALASLLLTKMEEQTFAKGIRTLYTIARAISPGMNITFARAGYRFGGRLRNNTQISGQIESMNVWYKTDSMQRS